MMIQLFPHHVSALGAAEKDAVIAAARRDFVQIATALQSAVGEGCGHEAIQHRHALIGLCRLFGADALELASEKLTPDGSSAAFEACLEQTLAALDALVSGEEAQYG